MKLYAILVPAPVYGPKLGDPTMAHSKEIKANDPKGWDEFVNNLAGGLTVVKKTTGQWMNPATRQTIREFMVEVQIACTEEQLNQILQFSLDYYKQDAIMAYEVSNNVFFASKTISN